MKHTLLAIPWVVTMVHFVESQPSCLQNSFGTVSYKMVGP